MVNIVDLSYVHFVTKSTLLLFSRLRAVLIVIVVLTPHMSGHLMKPFKYTEDFKGAIKNIKNY